MSLAERIKQARKAKEMTQEDLALALDVKSNTISNWENGISKPDADMIMELCDQLDVDANWLMAYKPKCDLPYDEDILEAMEVAFQRPELRALFSVGKSATREDIELAISIIELRKTQKG